MTRTAPDYMMEYYLLLPKTLFFHGLNDMDIGVFIFARHCESRRNKPGWPSLKLISQATQLCENSVRKALRRLREKQLIRGEQTIYFGADTARCRGGYFLLPRQILFLGLGSKELAIYAYLMYLEDRVTYQCWPSYKTIGRNVGIKATNTVRKYIRSLEEKDLIYTEQTVLHRADGSVRNGNLLYTIRPIADAIEARNRRQMDKLELLAHAQTARCKVRRKTAGRPDTGLSAHFSEEPE